MHPVPHPRTLYPIPVASSLIPQPSWGQHSPWNEPCLPPSTPQCDTSPGLVTLTWAEDTAHGAEKRKWVVSEGSLGVLGQH